MATDKNFVEFVLDQIDEKEEVTSRPMFGEYGMHSKGKFIALICNNKLYIKPTVAGREFIKSPTEAPPYTGANNYFLIGDKIEDKKWLSKLIHLTRDELPEPKPKKKKIKKN